MTDEVRTRNGVAGLQLGEQNEQRVDLRLRKRLATVVVELDPDRDRVEVLYGSPARDAGMPGAMALVHELKKGAVAINDVMRTDFARRIGERT